MSRRPTIRTFWPCSAGSALTRPKGSTASGSRLRPAASRFGDSGQCARTARFQRQQPHAGGFELAIELPGDFAQRFAAPPPRTADAGASSASKSIRLGADGRRAPADRLRRRRAHAGRAALAAADRSAAAPRPAASAVRSSTGPAPDCAAWVVSMLLAAAMSRWPGAPRRRRRPLPSRPWHWPAASAPTVSRGRPGCLRVPAAASALMRAIGTPENSGSRRLSPGSGGVHGKPTQQSRRRSAPAGSSAASRSRLHATDPQPLMTILGSTRCHASAPVVEQASTTSPCLAKARKIRRPLFQEGREGLLGFGRAQPLARTPRLRA